MILKKVISGGQIGVDQLALQVARSYGLETGGTAPKGYRTARGPQRALLTSYGLAEGESTGYQERTLRNVLHSDGTLILAENLNSPGSRLTLKFAKEHGKPYYCVDLKTNFSKTAIARWIVECKIETLNIAGNREVQPARVEETLCQVFDLLFLGIIK